MNIPISKRLLCCAACVVPGSRVADIGTDHGYLAIYLLHNQIASSVIAADLRRLPLENARKNAMRFGLLDKITFLLSDGLKKIAPESIDTIVCAGMGGDLIAQILGDANWLKSPVYQLVLQPQSAVHELRRWLSESGFSVTNETLAYDGGFLYPVMQVHYGNAQQTSPGQHFISEQLLHSNSAYLRKYFLQIRNNLQKTVNGISCAKSKVDPDKQSYYAAALQEVNEMGKEYGICE